MSDDPIYLRLDPGFEGDRAVKVRVSPDVAEDLREGLEVEGVYVGRIAEFAAAPQLAIYAVSIGSGFAPLVAALMAFYGRHKDRKFIVPIDGQPVDLSGRSDDEAFELFEKILRRLREDQARRDGEDGPTPGGA